MRPRKQMAGIALVMVLLVLAVLALIGTPFVVSMLLQERSSQNFEGLVRARSAALAARNHAVSHLARTVHARESEREALNGGALTVKRGKIRATRANDLSRTRRPVRGRRGRQRGFVIREDLGDKRRSTGRGRSGRREAGDAGESQSMRPGLIWSQKGPTEASFDSSDELTTTLPASVEIPANTPALGRSPRNSNRTTTAREMTAASAGGPTTISFRDQSGITASARIVDEQGKINLNTAPPGVLASLFAVGVLADSLKPGETVLVVDGAGSFQSDGNRSTVDGAVAVVHPVSGRVEVITYRHRSNGTLSDCFRGAFFSLPSKGEFPRESLVYDVRGWKIGYHRLRAGAIGGFSPAQLTEFPTVESVREIANWPIASFFLSRFRGVGLTADFLAENGINAGRLEKLGLDPAFIDRGSRTDKVLAAELGRAQKIFRAKRISRAFVEKLRKARGVRAVIAFAGRIGPLNRKQAGVLRTQLDKGIKKAGNKPLRLSRRYVEACLENLAEVYKRPGIETLRPGDLKYLRDAVTVSSTVPTQWSEQQVITSQVLAGNPGGASIRLARPGDHGGGAIVRISSLKRPELVEYNQTTSRGATVPEGGAALLFPLAYSYETHDAAVSFLQRHPVNVNTASVRVLRAVLTGISGYERNFSRSATQDRAVNSERDTEEGGSTPGIVTPAEANRLAIRLKRRLINGPQQLFETLTGAAESGEIDLDDVRAVFVNSLQPNHHRLRVGTVGFCYASGDVYTIESRGILRDPAGGELAHAAVREIVDVSPPRSLHWTLFTQQDFTSEIFISQSSTSLSPQDHARHSVTLPGLRSHLVRTTPLLYRYPRRTDLLTGAVERGGGGDERREGQSFLSFAVPGAEHGSIRLEVPETMRTRYDHGPVQHFRDTREGQELPGGEPWSVPGFELSGGGTVVGGNSTGSAILDLSNLPGSVEAWVRFKTLPQERNHEGFFVIIDAGTERERNRISLLYDPSKREWIARIYDSSLPDPSIPKEKQFFQIRARRPLDIDTWYHLRLEWAGAYAGGLQLFIDGLPVGVTNYSAELRSSIRATGGGAVSMRFEDPDFPFPRQGVVRINNELIELEGSSIRRAPPSHFRKWLGANRQRMAALEAERAGQDGTSAGAQGQVGGLQGPADPITLTMRGPWNRRGTTPGVHLDGSRVHLHGYSLEMVRKLNFTGNEGESFERQASGADLVWSRGGARMGDKLLPWSFPEEPQIYRIAHYNYERRGVGPDGAEDTTASAGGEGGQAGVIVPVFAIRFLAGSATPNLPNMPLQNALQQVMKRFAISSVTVYSPTFQFGGKSYNAVDYFQREGVLRHGSRAGGDSFLRYSKGGAPPAGHPATIVTDPADFSTPGRGGLVRLDGVLLEAQTQALHNISVYAGGAEGGANDLFSHGRSLIQCSVLADRNVEQLYPRLGILEVRGAPAEWERHQRPNFHGQPLLNHNPEDMVEWLRYEIVDDNLFIALGRWFEHRGYPATYRRSYEKNQMEHYPGDPIRLVVELADGGAGYGDYVTIATDDPDIGESQVYRVYRSVERNDGRFFVSLLGANGGDHVVFDRAYSKSENPRLVKFPTGDLPRVGSGRLLFFGDAVDGRDGGVGYIPNDVQEEIETGFIIDEVRMTRNPLVSQPAFQPKHVLVPLENNRVKHEQIGDGLEVLGGVLLENRTISRANPLEVLVVAVDRDLRTKQMRPELFGRGLERGVLRINDELFYFENPGADDEGTAGDNPAGGSGTLKPGAFRRPKASSEGAGRLSLYRGFQGESNFDGRMRPVNVSANLSGKFEPEGFVRVRDTTSELAPFFNEVLYYRSLGDGLRNCLRGQFCTPMIRGSSGGVVDNVTSRLRLIGRGLLGTKRRTHGFGDPVVLVTSVSMTEITAPLTNTGLAVRDTREFPPFGYLLIDSGQPGRPFEIVSYTARRGENLFERPRDELGVGILRGCFGTVPQGIGPGMFAYAMPYRHFDRYEPETESEHLAYFQKAFRVRDAHWRSLTWRERMPKSRKERLVDIVVAARFDGAPDWSTKPTNSPGGLYFLEAPDYSARGGESVFDLDVVADELEIRVYFRYKTGCFQRVSPDYYRDDWKETPILESLMVEYGKAGRVLRHEETDF